MKKIKIIIGSIVAAIIVRLRTTTAVMSNRINKLNCEIAEATTNIKAYELENSALKDNTIEQLNYSKDSLNQKINKLRKELKIKDKDIQKLQYIVSENSKKDSVFIHDTIFREKVKVDTTMGDN